MQLVIRDGYVVAHHKDGQDILNDYPEPEHTIVQWDGPAIVIRPDEVTGEMPLDPRSPSQKVGDGRKRYLQRRLRRYPPVRACLQMIFRDMRDGTTEYVDTIQAINDQFQPPT